MPNNYSDYKFITVKQINFALNTTFTANRFWTDGQKELYYLIYDARWCYVSSLCIY